MNPEIYEPNLSIPENVLLINRGIDSEIIKRKREITAVNFPEFLPLFDAMDRVDNAKLALENTPYDNPETNFKRQQLEIEYKEVLQAVKQEMERVDVTINNSRFVMYIDQMDAVKDVYDNFVRPSQNQKDIIKN